ncbi:fasciclin-like arabinogalactan protein 12 [Cornus florida]|uniref:fasciclin-like arabinogalactan protein 12 n=1 Tax=Cornus florida TaxID=4283 RepID=UPI002896F8DC|nr:fasciclin-like arabinogalactan protein 12 [Cornus florida]
MMNRILFFLSFTSLFHFHFGTTLAQSPAASPAAPPSLSTVPLTAAPPTPGTANIIKILEKDGHFTLFVRLLKNTHVGDQEQGELRDSNNGLTLFAPSDSAFSTLTSGTINSLNDLQQTELVQFHFLPTFITTTLFQTVSNPLRTQAGDTAPDQFPLNVTTTGNQVTVSTGVMKASVSGTVYTDGKLAVYQVDSVLLPSKIFGPQAKKAIPAAAANSPTSSSSNDGADAVASGAVSLTTMHGMVVTIGVSVAAASFLL